MIGERLRNIFGWVDIWTVLLYLAIVTAGALSILAASYNENSLAPFALSHFYMKQLVWIGIAWVAALVVLLLDKRFIHMLAYPAYFAGLALLVAALMFGKEVNGARAWFEFGSFRVQPVEFVKIATALALARVMSSYSFSISRSGDLAKVAAVICAPLFIIVLQNDTGSGIVLCSFLFVLYREGLNKWLCIPILLVAGLFISSFLLSPTVLLVLLIIICTLSEAMMSGEWRSRIVYLAGLALSALLLFWTMHFIAPGRLSFYAALLTVTFLSFILIAVYAYRANLRSIFLPVALFVGAMIFLPTTDSSTPCSGPTSATASSVFWGSSAIRGASTTTSTSRRSPSVPAGGPVRASCRVRRSSTASCPSGIPTSSSALSARSGVFSALRSSCCCCVCSFCGSCGWGSTSRSLSDASIVIASLPFCCSTFWSTSG